MLFTSGTVVIKCYQSRKFEPQKITGKPTVISRGEHGVIMTDQLNAMVEVCPSLSYRMKVRTTKLTHTVKGIN